MPVSAQIRHAAAGAAYAVADGAPIETATTCMAGTLCLIYQDLHPPGVMLGGYSRRSTALSQSAESRAHSGCVIAASRVSHNATKVIARVKPYYRIVICYLTLEMRTSCSAVIPEGPGTGLGTISGVAEDPVCM